MNPATFSVRRLNACALAVALLLAQSAMADGISGTQSITADIGSASYDIGVVGTPSIITIAPSSGTTVNFAGDVYVVNGGPTTLVLGSKRATVAGSLSTDGANYGFTLTPNATANTPTYSSTNLDVKDGTGTGKITTNDLVMAGGESFGVTLTGSLRNGASFGLISSSHNITGAGNTFSKAENGDGQISDNSYVIDSSVAIDGTGRNVVYTASRSNDQYISKSSTQGHFSNPAALTLGTIAKEGRQLGDLVTAINLLDIDSNGYGNNQANLAVQVKRLAPIANNAYLLSVLDASDRILSGIDDRLSSLRGDVPSMKTAHKETGWAKVYATSAKQSGFDDYDGFKTATNGIALGLDHGLEQGWIGAALAVSTTDIEQLGFRTGESATLNSQEASIFGSAQWGATYLDGILSAGQSSVSGGRSTAVGRIANMQYRTNSTSVKATLGHRIKLQDGKSVITPMFGMQTIQMDQPSYTETGAGDLGLIVDAQTYRRLRSTLGVRFNTESRIGDTPSYTSVYLAYSRDSGLDNTDVHASYSGATDPQYTAFTTTAAALERNLFELGAGTTLAMSQSSGLQLRYDLQHRQSYNAQGVQAKFIWKF